MLHSDPDFPDPQLTVRVEDFKPALATVLRWAENCRLSLRLTSEQGASLEPLWDQLRNEGVALLGVRKVWCKGLLLTTGNLSEVLPNLQELHLDACRVGEGMLPLAGCSRLQKLALDSESRAEACNISTEVWHMQLASLPSLSSLAINVRHHPLALLQPLAGQLTELRLLGSFSIWSDTPAAQLQQAVLLHAPQLTNLRSLQMEICTPEWLTSLGNTLPQLQRLQVGSGCWVNDSVISALMQHPQLTSVAWTLMVDIQQPHNQQPCQWQELQLGCVSPQTLARLPLHSLTQPLRLHGLDFPYLHSTAGDISAAVANISRCQAGVAAPHDKSFCILVQGDSVQSNWDWDYMQAQMQQIRARMAAADHSAQLLSLSPLIPRDITSVTFNCRYTDWPINADLVTGLQQIMPSTVSSITIHDAGAPAQASFWAQLAASFPQLRSLEFTCEDQCTPADIGEYFAACAARGTPGAPQHAADVKIVWTSEDAQEDTYWKEWVMSFNPLKQHLRLQGFAATVTASRGGWGH